METKKRFRSENFKIYPMLYATRMIARLELLKDSNFQSIVMKVLNINHQKVTRFENGAQAKTLEICGKPLRISQHGSCSVMSRDAN